MKSLQKAFARIAVAIFLITSSLCSVAQRSDRPITAEEQKQIIDKAFVLLKANYIFPDKVAVMEKGRYQWKYKCI